MEIKKSPKADLEDKRVLFTQIGLIIALALVFLAFEYRSYDRRVSDLAQRVAEDVPEEIIPITEQKFTPPPPPPPQQVTVQEKVEDDVLVDDLDLKVDVDQKTVMFRRHGKKKKFLNRKFLLLLNLCLNFRAVQPK
jgi:hypothetical protein